MIETGNAAFRNIRLVPIGRVVAAPRIPLGRKAGGLAAADFGAYVIGRPATPRPRRRYVLRALGLTSGGLAESATEHNGTRRLDAAPSISHPELRTVRSGTSYRVTSPPDRGMVHYDLARELETVFERFALDQGFTAERPLAIHFARGYTEGSQGHGEGRAADIVAVGDKTFTQWKKEWDVALAAANELADPKDRSAAAVSQMTRNLGYRLYKALQHHGGWRQNPGGWRPYKGVVQLFGPWTPTEGPWKPMRFEQPTVEEQTRLADQHWVYKAHQDHIHVAR